MPNASGTLTSSQGSLVLGSSPNDTVTFTPTGTYSVEYPLGTVAISASTSTQTLNLSGGQFLLTVASGSVAWSLTDNNDGFPLSTTETTATRALVSGAGICFVAGLSSAVASAAANTAIIQAALNARGTVIIADGGTIPIIPPLKIGSNTKIVLANDTRLQGQGGNGLNMLQSEAYTRATTSVTVAWTAGRLATITWAGHGRAVGDYVWLRGGTPSQYQGVFRVISVTNSSTFAVRLIRTPTTAPSGSWVACVADVNIGLEGGTWDYNSTVNYVSTGVDRHNILISGAANVSLKDVLANDSIKYAFAFGAINGLRAINLGSEYTSADCVKNYGPMFNAHYSGVRAKCGDDTITFQTKEAVAYAEFAWTSGDIINCSVRDVHSDTLHNVIGIYPSDTEFMDQILFENINGTGVDSGCYINSGQSIGYLGVITIRGMNAAGNNGVGISCNVINAQCLTIDGMQVVSDGILNQNAIRFSALSSVRVLNVQNIVSDTNTGISSTTTTIANNGVVDVINFSNSRLTSYTGNTIQGVTLNSGATTGEINLRGIQVNCIGANVAPVYLNSGIVGTPKVNFQGCYISGGSGGCPGVQTTANCDISVSDCVLDRVTYGFLFVPSGSPVVSLRASGNQVVSTTWLGVSGTPVISVFGWDIKVAPNATGVARTAGSFCFNNAAGVGTLVQNNLVVCDATGAANSWKQLTDTTKAY